MIHNMKLHIEPFNSIAYGSKTIELRLNDEKRQQINVGDTIVFNCAKNNDTITARVKELHKFADFKELYNALPLDKCGYTAHEVKSAKYTDMYDYYTEEQIKKYGALGIELCNIETICDIKSALLNEQIYTLLAPSVFNPTTKKLQKRAQKYFDSSTTNVYVFIQDGKYVGIMVFDVKENIATINDIAVKIDFRGRGIGSSLVKFIFEKFITNKVIAETDDDAVNFYKKCGFEIEKIETGFDTNRYRCQLIK